MLPVPSFNQPAIRAAILPASNRLLKFFSLAVSPPRDATQYHL
jgi:hypothetical protein